MAFILEEGEEIQSCKTVLQCCWGHQQVFSSAAWFQARI